MRASRLSRERPLHWVGSAKKDLLSFPADVVGDFGYVLGVIQFGGVPPSSRPWKGEGPGICELREDDPGGTYRVVYAVRFEHAVYVLHCFHKKSPTGIRTAKSDVELIKARLRMAALDHEERYGSQARTS